MATIIKKAILILLFFSINTAFSQSNFLEKTPALLGLKHGYGEGQYISCHPTKNDKIGTFYYGQKKELEDFKKALRFLKTNTEDLRFVIEENQEHPITTVYSKKLADSLRGYYIFELIDTELSVDDTDNFYEVFSAKLDISKINSDNSKYSYLFGGFIRHGILENGVYAFKIFNNQEKANNIVKFLQDLSMKVVLQKSRDDLIPKPILIYFEPTDRFKALIRTFNTYEPLPD
jgi:hypothetical protein